MAHSFLAALVTLLAACEHPVVSRPSVRPSLEAQADLAAAELGVAALPEYRAARDDLIARLLGRAVSTPLSPQVWSASENAPLASWLADLQKLFTTDPSVLLDALSKQCPAGSSNPCLPSPAGRPKKP